MIEAIGSSETLVLTLATRRHISEDGILPSFLGLFFNLEGGGNKFFPNVLAPMKGFTSEDGPQVFKLIKTPWPLVRKRTIPTDRPPLVDEI
jgi:hypothetical protein